MTKKQPSALRLFWWLPLYLFGLYQLTLYLDGLDFAPDIAPAQVQYTDAQQHNSGTISLPKNIADIAEPMILLLNVTQNIALYYPDGSLVADAGQMQDPISRNKHRPLLFRLHTTALKGANTLQFTLASTPSKQPRLDNVYIGSAEQLEPAWQNNNLLRQSIVKVLTATLFIAAGLIFVIWLYLRQHYEYLWYAIGTALWGVHSINLVIRDIAPLSDALWSGFVPFVIGMSVLSIITMVYYFMPPGAKGRERHTLRLLALWGGGLLLAIPLFVLPMQGMYEWQDTYRAFWFGFLAVLFGLVLSYVIRLFWDKQTPTRFLFVLSGFAMLVFGLHDLMVILDESNLNTAPRPYLLHFAAMFTLITQYLLLIRRFVSSLQKTQYYATHLESLVAQREAELRHNYEKIRVMEQDKVVAEERERIMRDIHDGFGGHLVSTLAMLERPDAQISDARSNIQDALTDLRLVIDSLDFDTQDITTALGMFRSRNARRIKQAGFELQWGIEDLNTPQGFGAEKTLQLLRIVQEATTNALKHSGGNTIRISSGINPDGHSFVQVEDNGLGIPDSYQAGKGLASMRKRAQAIGVGLTISSSPYGSGTRIHVRLPSNGLMPAQSSDTPAEALPQ